MSTTEAWTGVRAAAFLRGVLSGKRFRVAADVAKMAERLRREGALTLPRPGYGETFARYEALSEIAAADLSLARLVEGHTDALAIAAELGHDAADALYGVWAAEAGDRNVEATRDGADFRLRGCKPYASGAHGLGRALVTARTPDGMRLFDVDLRAPGVGIRNDTWAAVGMASSDSGDVAFDDVRVAARNVLGGVDAYVKRAGFWWGSVGVAACWFGGALGCARMVRARFTTAPPDVHALAHLGAISATCHAMKSVLRDAADAIDHAPRTDDRSGELRALRVRQVVEAGCQDVLARCGRASGTAPLAFDEAHARRAADLVVYLRQHHAERDLATLGRIVLEGGECV